MCFFVLFSLRTSLVPVISFGENELYPLILNRIPWGRTFLGHIPRRHRVVTVGKNEQFNQQIEENNDFLLLFDSWRAD